MRKTVLALTILIAMAGCKKTETGTSTTTQSTSTTATTATVAPAPQPTATVAPTAGAIANADGDKAGAHVDITELKRTSGGTVNLKFTISNAGPAKLDLNAQYLGDSNISRDHYRDVSGIHLLDPVNKKKYFVVTDAEKRCVCSKEIPDVDPGSKVNLWAKFPAPPPEVTKVTIEVPHFAPMDDVPIAQ